MIRAKGNSVDDVHYTYNNEEEAQHQHLKMYKPTKVLTQFVFNHRKRRNRTLLGEFVDAAAFGKKNNNIMAIGRLDEDSEGLLLLTTDGKVSERVRGKTIERNIRYK
jgi:23S rRNA pseudouridine2457 synthase